MKVIEMYNKCMEIYEENERAYWVIGLRFEDKEREIGEICERSKHNEDREDERDFPVYGTAEYEDMFELGGTSAWSLNSSDTILQMLKGYNGKLDDEYKGCSKHAYIIAGQDNWRDDDVILDYNEVVIKNAKVIAKIF